MNIRTFIKSIYCDFKKTSKAQILKFKYQRTLCRLRKDFGRRKVVVAFCVSEIAKWKAQSLYDRLKASDDYRPIILVYPSPLDLSQKQSDIDLLLEDKREYFKDKRMEVLNIWGGTIETCVIPDDFRPDIIFYQQPWDILPAMAPFVTADYALSFYIPYYMINNFNICLEFGLPLHYQVFGYIVQNEEVAKAYSSMLIKRHYAGKCLGLGHTIVDNLVAKTLLTETNSVIYAPHFSFPVAGTGRILTYSTFLENGELILQFARQHPEFKWIFKPHPKLKQELRETGVWSEEKIEYYYDEWAKVGVVCTTADYIEYFQKSFVMITDCGSFLTEYSCLDKPIIRLYYYKDNMSPNPMLEKLYETFYYAHNNEELLTLLENIICQRQDPNQIDRHQEIVRLGLNRSESSQRIFDYFNSLLSSRKSSKL